MIELDVIIEPVFGVVVIVVVVVVDCCWLELIDVIACKVDANYSTNRTFLVPLFAKNLRRHLLK